MTGVGKLRSPECLPYYLFRSIKTAKRILMKFLIHIAQGPDNPTRAALAFLVAKSAREEGHEVAIFLAGDGVHLLTEDVLSVLTGLGTGKLSDHYEALEKGGVRFYLSGNSCKARGITEEVLVNKPAEFALPTVLVRLVAESDRVLVY